MSTVAKLVNNEQIIDIWNDTRPAPIVLHYPELTAPIVPGTLQSHGTRLSVGAWAFAGG